MTRNFLIAAAGMIVSGIVAMFLVYVLVFRGPAELEEFRNNCTAQQGAVVQTVDGIVCKINNEEVMDYE